MFGLGAPTAGATVRMSAMNAKQSKSRERFIFVENDNNLAGKKPAAKNLLASMRSGLL